METYGTGKARQIEIISIRRSFKKYLKQVKVENTIYIPPKVKNPQVRIPRSTSANIIDEMNIPHKTRIMYDRSGQQA